MWRLLAEAASTRFRQNQATLVATITRSKWDVIIILLLQRNHAVLA